MMVDRVVKPETGTEIGVCTGFVGETEIKAISVSHG